MANAPTLRRKQAILWLLVATALAAVPSLTAAAGRPLAEAPAQVAIEGQTADQYLQQQAELSIGLSDELPALARQRAFQIRLTPEEIAAIDFAPRQQSPLKIGLVKPLAPGIEVHGLALGPSALTPRRGDIGDAVATQDGGAVWAAVVNTEAVGGIRLHIEDLSLPSNASLYFYSQDGQVHGPYTGSGLNDSGELWTGTIFGTEVILQVRLSAPVTEAEAGAVSLRVAEAGLITPSFAAGFRPPTKVTHAPPPPGWPCGNASCVVDASCVNTTIANNLKLAEAKMEWIQGAFIYTCSGGLINDNNPSQSNFFLTANHCVSKNTNAQNVNFYWRFATLSCQPTTNAGCNTNNGWPYQTSGSTVSKSGRKGDFTLLHLNTAPPAGSVFLGWTNANVANANGTDLFRVSNPNFGPQVYSEHDVDTSAPTCSGWPRGERIYSRDIVGATDGGSSGSPITNSSLQIVGQLSGACGLNPSSVCSGGPGEDNATVDGAFAFYYASVQPFLNP